jgi:lipopolysaccharide transport system ATP-binding protein
VRVDALGKAYRFYPSRWARLSEWIVPGTQRHELQWVLRNLSFSVAPGESLGIIGRNGAGKSTLLKLITGTTHPARAKFTRRAAAALSNWAWAFTPNSRGARTCS